MRVYLFVANRLLDFLSQAFQLLQFLLDVGRHSFFCL